MLRLKPLLTQEHGPDLITAPHPLEVGATFTMNRGRHKGAAKYEFSGLLPLGQVASHVRWRCPAAAETFSGRSVIGLRLTQRAKLKGAARLVARTERILALVLVSFSSSPASAS